jgi:aspartyl-tRNA(Asn)/glutamyl-tRNA(Gln) amidotransferase subunit A
MPLPTLQPTPTPQLHDLHATVKQLQEGKSSAPAQLERAIDIAQSSACQHVFLKTMFDEARQQTGHQKGAALQGLAISVKDLFDVAGQTTAAASQVLADAPVAAQDCPAVARLKAAGGVVIGRTNMSEFAFSGVGVNPHFGTPANAASGAEPRIPGGSSSGAAVSVATGAAFIGLGSDTGGSIRIPAALNGIVGFKSTARLVPTDGALPLSTTLDTVCAMTRSVRDAMLTHEILSAKGITRSLVPLSNYRLAIVKPIMQDDLDTPVSTAWQRTLKQLRASGAQIDEIDLPELNELASINSTGGFSAAESYAWHHALLQRHASNYDPRVLARIQRGAGMSAREYIELTAARRQWINRMEHALRGFDAVLSPTVPMVAPLIATVAPGAERDEAFFKINALLLRNTSVVNMLDGCAISIPCQRPSELPVGLMIWAQAMADDTVLNIALQVEQLLATP